MDRPPFVTAVIPTHDRAGRVGGAVSSALAQTWTDLEVVVVDDGSSDETQEILRAIRDPRLRVLRQDNRGVSAARNLGVAAARGELIALLDSDDRWLPDKLALQVPFLLERGLEICQTEETWFRHGRRVNPGRRYAKPAGRFFELALETCLVSPSCVLFTRRFWDGAGPFDESLPACEDYDLWLRALTRFDIGLLETPLTVREGGHPDQLSLKIVGLDLYRIRSIARLIASEPLDPGQRACAEAALRRKVRLYVQGCLKRDKPEEAARVAALAEEALGTQVANP
jgi:glycosyltransferase involved in cell wall biosynthesis